MVLNSIRILSSRIFVIGLSLTALSVTFGCRSSQIQDDADLENAEGTPSRGSLKNGVRLNASGSGYVHKLENGRNPYLWSWGTEYTIDALTAAAAKLWLSTEGKTSTGVEAEPIVINDLSYQEGRKHAGHASHQQGLSIDLGYFHKKGIAVDQVNGPYLDFDRRKNEVDYDRMAKFLEYLDGFGRQRCSGVRVIFIHKNLASGFNTALGKIGLNIEIDLGASSVHRDHLHVDMIRADNDYEYLTEDGGCKIIKGRKPLVDDPLDQDTDQGSDTNESSNFDGQSSVGGFGM